jgi:YD repeat-containing protein
VTTAYYSNFVKRRGVPEGIGALTEAQVRRRELSFRFYLRGKQVEKVEAIDRRGRLNVRHGILTHLAPPDALSFFTTTPGIDFSRLSLSGTTAFVGNLARDAGACSWEYQRDRDGNLVKEIARDVAGRILWTFQLTSADTGHYTDERGFILSRASSGAAYVKLFYTPDGLEKEVRYLARTGKPRPDAAGIFGRRFEHDHHGMITAVTFLGPRDRPVLHSLGLARITRRWDERGQLLEEAYLDLNGNPARGRFGRGSRVTWTYDEDGNPTSEEVVGLDGSSSSRKSQFTYEKQGNLKTSEVRFSPGEGQPERLTRTVYEYDSDDNCILIRSFDAAGQPIIGTSTGSAGQALGYDEQGRITSVTFLGTDGKPAEAAPDPERPYRRRGKEVRIVYTYNERDQVLSESLFGLDDNPATDAFGVARYTCTYDDAGRPTELQRNGPDGKPLPSERGFTRRTWKYDEQGRLEETASYDADGDLILVPVPSSDSPTVPRSTSLVGIFLLSRAMRTANFAGGRVTLAYDDHGNLANVTLHGPDGESLTDAEGFTRVEAKYDDLGNLAELTTFASEGRPKANRNGVARMTWTHDGFGNLTQIATFGPEGQRVASVYGVARHTRQYDEQYNLVEEAFFGTDDKLTLGTFGYARARFKYDGESNLISSAYTDIEGKSVATRPVWLYRADRTNPLDMAADLRLEAGDVLLTYAGEQVRCARMFLQRKRLERQGGERKELRILRNGKTLTLKIPAGALRLDDFFRFSRTGPLPASRIPGRLEPIRVIETRGESSIAEMR